VAHCGPPMKFMAISVDAYYIIGDAVLQFLCLQSVDRD